MKLSSIIKTFTNENAKLFKNTGLNITNYLGIKFYFGLHEKGIYVRPLHKRILLDSVTSIKKKYSGWLNQFT